MRTPLFPLIAVLCLIVGTVLVCGCSSEPTDTTTPPTTIPATTQGTQTGAITTPFLIVDPGLEPIAITHSAKPVTTTETVLVYYTLSKEGTVMASEGWELKLTAFAYNYADVETGFNPQSYEDVIAANIPYATRRIHLYPGSNYNDQIEVQQAPLQGREMNSTLPYNYGLIFQDMG